MYRPSSLPVLSEVLQPLAGYLSRELAAIAKILYTTDLMILEPVYRPPEKLRPGMIVHADGVHWNPGAGAGIYAYYGGSWNKLG